METYKVIAYSIKIIINGIVIITNMYYKNVTEV